MAPSTFGQDALPAIALNGLWGNLAANLIWVLLVFVGSTLALWLRDARRSRPLRRVLRGRKLRSAKARSRAHYMIILSVPAKHPVHTQWSLCSLNEMRATTKLAAGIAGWGQVRSETFDLTSVHELSTAHLIALGGPGSNDVSQKIIATINGRDAEQNSVLIVNHPGGKSLKLAGKEWIPSHQVLTDGFVTDFAVIARTTNPYSPHARTRPVAMLLAGCSSMGTHGSCVAIRDPEILHRINRRVRARDFVAVIEVHGLAGVVRNVRLLEVYDLERKKFAYAR